MRAANVSSEPIASPPSLAGAAEPCASCGAPLAGDQRYCLECGERHAPPSSVLLGGSAQARAAQPPAAPYGLGAGPPPALTHETTYGASRNNAVTVIAGVGVLLLAMGVGVLIGRSGGSSKPVAAATPQILTVGTASTPGASPGASPASSFTDDWPAGTNGYTVQLQELPQATTQVSAVEAAKVAAGAKGAKSVGALKSEDFTSLTAGSYVVYSGVYPKRSQAQKALGALKRNFPAATVVAVSNAAGAVTQSKGAGAGAGAGGSGASKPVPPIAAEELQKAHGKSYEEKSKSLPNQVET